MDPKELRGLYEASSEVYAPQQIDESKHTAIAAPGGRNRRSRKSVDMRKPYNDTMRRQDQLAMSKGKPFNDRVKKDSPMQYKSNEEYVGEAQYTQPPQPPTEVRPEPAKKNKLDPGATVGTGIAAAYLGNELGKKIAKKPRGIFKTEEVDIYDIVLSHLLDEGYADTIESAEAIMVNMSEEWRDEIIDEGLGKLAALGAAGLMMTQTGFKAPPGLLNKPLKEPQKTELVSKPKPTQSRDEKAERSQFDKRYNEYGGDAAARKRGLLPPK
jgi:hypothetical protein